MYNRCRFTEEPVNGEWPYDEDFPYLCKDDASCPVGLYCKNPMDAGLGKDIDNPINQELINYGLTVFDDLLQAMLTVF